MLRQQERQRIAIEQKEIKKLKRAMKKKEKLESRRKNKRVLDDKSDFTSDIDPEEALKTFGQGCKYFFQGNLTPEPICKFRIQGCSRLGHCRFTHIFPKHVNMPRYCEPFLRGRCLEEVEGGLKKQKCYKLLHINYNSLNKMFFQRLERLSKSCEFCDISSELVSKEVPATQVGGGSVQMVGESQKTNFVPAKPYCNDIQEEKSQKVDKKEETKGMILVEDVDESKHKFRESAAFALDREDQNLVDKTDTVKKYEEDESLGQFDLFIAQLRDLLYLRPGHSMTMADFTQVMKLNKKGPSDYGFNRHIDLLTATDIVIIIGTGHCKVVKLLEKETKAALESFKANSTKLLSANSPLTLERFGKLYCDQFTLQFHRKLCEQTLENILKNVPSIKRHLSTPMCIKLLSLAEQSSSESVKGPSENVKNSPKKCLFFNQKGRCHFGHKCSDIH